MEIILYEFNSGTEAGLVKAGVVVMTIMVEIGNSLDFYKDIK